jgi:glucuronokinase
MDLTRLIFVYQPACVDRDRHVPCYNRCMAIVVHCPARAALAGNPSDGYGGFVVAIPVPGLAATVTIEPAEQFEINHSPTPDDTFADLASLINHVDRFGMDDARRLVLATIRTLVRQTGVSIEPLRIDVSTTIPRSVGLAGSSAIVIATLRAFAVANRDATWSAMLTTDPDKLATMALSVEADELGIGAGLQDRLVQSHGVAIAMDFATTTPTTRPLGSVPGRFLIAYRPAGAEPGGALHNRLRSDFERDQGATRSIMSAIGAQGRLAAAAIDAADSSALGAAMDRTLELRAELLPLDHHLLAAAATVRAHGGHVNWTGSGGAIVVLIRATVDDGPLRDRLTFDHGCHTIDV